MKLRKENCYIITGGPGVGKTTLVNKLAQNNFHVVDECARAIIKREISTNGDGLPWKNRWRYAQLMLEASLKDFKTVPSNLSAIYFFDRGILDTICYVDMIGLEASPEMIDIGKNNLYNRIVFILPPWQEIYHTDSERKQTWEEALLTFEKMKETYLSYGYEVIVVPIDTVENRVGFILDKLHSR